MHTNSKVTIFYFFIVLSKHQKYVLSDSINNQLTTGIQVNFFLLLTLQSIRPYHPFMYAQPIDKPFFQLHGKFHLNLPPSPRPYQLLFPIPCLCHNQSLPPQSPVLPSSTPPSNCHPHTMSLSLLCPPSYLPTYMPASRHTCLPTKFS